MASEKKVYVSGAWHEPERARAAMDAFAAAGFSVYDWTAEAHKSLTLYEQRNAIRAFLEYDAAFVLVIEDEAYDYGASRMLLGYCLLSGKAPVIVVDAKDGTRTPETFGGKEGHHRIVSNVVTLPAIEERRLVFVHTLDEAIERARYAT